METNEIRVKAIGGEIVASSVQDDEYPGIRISFEPDAGTNGGETLLAIVEQSFGKLQLCSYMDTWMDEPRVIPCNYDQILMSQVGYHFYKGLCMEQQNEPLDFNGFLKKIFYDNEAMRKVLPQDMYGIYLKSLPDRNSEGGGGNV